MRKREPCDLAAVWPLADVARHQGILSTEDLHDPERRPDATEGLEEVLQGLTDAGVGVEHDAPEFGVDQAHRDGRLELSTPRLGENPAAEACTQNVELCLGHRCGRMWGVIGQRWPAYFF